jgi:hypothetical protein
MRELFVSVLLLSFLLRPARAWNAEGHMVVAQIAYNHLDSEVKAECDALIALPVFYASSGNSNFVTAACWADDIKSFTSDYNNWHYIDIPFSLDGTATTGVGANSFDVVRAIRQCVNTLQNPTADQTNQATALRFLLHFAGDIQQPLHSSTAVSAAHPFGDAGGNLFSLNGNWSNLHSLWDSGGGYLSEFLRRPLSTVDQTTLSNKAAMVEADYPYSVSIGSIPDPMDWALEGWRIAQTVSYVGISEGSTPSSSYLNAAKATAEQRMAIGGQRLAKLLSTIFVTNAPALTSAMVTNGNFKLSWDAVAGRIYRVQYKDQTDDPAWNDLTDMTASSKSQSFTDSLVQTQRFYRVVIVN